jgi:hypothetical protein
MEFYRYETIRCEGSLLQFADVELKTIPLIKETEKGYWIGKYEWQKKWIPKESRKRYAYPTKEEALKNYILRTEKRIKILKSGLSTSEQALDCALKIKL